MDTYIYVLDCDLYHITKTNKIGSSNNPLNRKNALQTALPNILKFLRIYRIRNKNINAYDIDEFLKTINGYQMYLGDICIKHYESNGGKEHYIIPNLDDLSKLFDILGIQYDIINDISIFDVLPIHIEQKGNEKIIKQLGEKLMQLQNKIILRNYQQICVDIFTKLLASLKYFQGIYYLATGTGKTIIAIHICLIHLKLYPTDNILWITFKNDIVDGQYDQFKKFKNIFILCNHGNFKVKTLRKTKGCVFIVLRQSLLGKILPKNTLQGVIYDECHDASKKSQKINDDIDGKTYEFLKSLNVTQQLKYRIGMSATPLTDSNRQNVGLLDLYGQSGQINYLYKYSLIDAIKDNWLLKPIFNYIKINSKKYSLMSLYRKFVDDDYQKNIELYRDTINKIIKEIKKIIIHPNHTYKKGIIWFPCVSMVKFFYSELQIKWYDDIKLGYSICNYCEFDQEFQKCENKFIMLACEKFTVGFDAVNLEFGINITYGESGYIIVQKLGRLTRKKPLQDFAHFYQFCEDNEYEKKALLNNMVKACENMGIFDIASCVHIQKNNKNIIDNNSKHMEHVIFNIDYAKMDYDMLKTTLAQMIKDIANKNIISKIDNGYLSYDIIKKNIAKYNLQSKGEYILLCNSHPEFPQDPLMIFGQDFIDWVDYLSIDRSKYYDFGTCKKKIIKYRNPTINIHGIYELALIAWKKDKRFPIPDMWGDFYGTHNGETLIELFNAVTV